MNAGSRRRSHPITIYEELKATLQNVEGFCVVAVQMQAERER